MHSRSGHGQQSAGERLSPSWSAHSEKVDLLCFLVRPAGVLYGTYDVNEVAFLHAYLSQHLAKSACTVEAGPVGVLCTELANVEGEQGIFVP